MVDDVLIYRDTEVYLMVINAGNCAKDMEFLKSNNISFNETAFEIISVQGPLSQDVLTPFVSGTKLYVNMNFNKP